MKIFLTTLVALAAVAALTRVARSEEEIQDFERLTPQLTGWSAVLQDKGGEPQYRVASKWDEPFSFSLCSERPHSGSNCLKWEFTGEVLGAASVGMMPIPVAGPVIEIRFFVRSEGLNGAGMLTFEEFDASGQRVAGHWAAAKIPTGEDWQEVIWSGKIAPAAATVRLRWIFSSVPAGAKIWFDDLSVKTLPE